MRQYYINKLECKNVEECDNIYVGFRNSWERRYKEHKET